MAGVNSKMNWNYSVQFKDELELFSSVPEFELKDFDQAEFEFKLNDFE